MNLKEKYTVRLTCDERKSLFELIRKGRANRGKLNRARILLKTDCGEEGENWTDDKIAEALYISSATVRNTRKSLVEEGLEKTLNNEVPLKSNRRRKIQGEEEAYLVALACSEAPEGYCKWTLRLLADKMVELGYVNEISHMTIGNALKKMKLSLGKKRSGASHQRETQNLFAKWKKC